MATYADETSLTIAADDLTRALDELQRETRPGHCDDPADLAKAMMAVKIPRVVVFQFLIVCFAPFVFCVGRGRPKVV